MARFIRILAYLGNIALLVTAVCFVVMFHRPEQKLLSLVLLLPPLMSLIVMYAGPDLEERRLRKQVNKAELRHRLAELESDKKK